MDAAIDRQRGVDNRKQATYMTIDGRSNAINGTNNDQTDNAQSKVADLILHLTLADPIKIA